MDILDVKDIITNLRGRLLSLDDYNLILQTLKSCKPLSEDEQRRKDLSNLHEQASHISNSITKIQEKCPHNGVIKEPKSNTGNYDPHEDCYWYECRCPVCDKHWIENY